MLLIPLLTITSCSNDEQLEKKYCKNF